MGVYLGAGLMATYDQIGRAQVSDPRVGGGKRERNSLVLSALAGIHWDLKIIIGMKGVGQYLGSNSRNTRGSDQT